MEGLAKSESSEDFGADRVLRHVGLATGVGDEENSQGWLFSDASHWVLFYGERSELGEISTLVTLQQQLEAFKRRKQPIAFLSISRK
jgi:hypothetical protein